MMKKLPVFVLVFLLISGLGMTADRYVNVNTGTDDLAAGRGESPGNPWKTIGFAVQNSIDNDTINVAAGDYKTSDTGLILINKPLKLLGPQADIDPRPSAGSSRIPGDNTTEAIMNAQNDMATILEIAAHGVEVNGFEIKNATGDMIESNSGGDWTTATLKCCIMSNAGDEGVQLRDVWHSSIEYNYLFNIAQDGINVSSGAWDTSIKNNEITTCNSDNGAIYVYNSYGPIYINDNYIHSCTACNGIKIYENYDWAEAEPFYVVNNLIENNNFNGTKYDQDGNAIQLYKPYKMANTNSSIEITGNILKNNDGNGDDLRQAGHGIYWHQANEVSNNNLPIDIMYNQILDNQGWGVLFEMNTTARDPSTTKVKTIHNTFSGNVLGQMSNTSSVYTDGSFNYWGASTGPATGDVNGPVVTDPYAFFSPIRQEIPVSGGVVSVDPAVNDRYKNLSVTIPGLDKVSACILRTPADRHGVNNAVEIMLDPPATLTADATVKIEFTIPEDEIIGGTWEQMRLAKWDGSQWTVLPDPYTTNKSNWPTENTVEGPTGSFSIFGAWPDPGTVPVELSTLSFE